MPLGPDQVRRPARLCRCIPVDRMPAGLDLAVGHIRRRPGGGGGEGAVGRGPIDSEVGQAENDLRRRYRCCVLLNRGLLAEHRAGEGRIGRTGRLKVQLICHHKESIHRGSKGGNVVEALGVAGRARVRIHGHLVVGVRMVDDVGDLCDQIGQAALIGAARALEVEVRAVETLRLHGSQKGSGQGCRGSGGRGELVERALVEIVHRQDDTVTRRMSPGDQAGKSLTLIAIPAGS